MPETNAKHVAVQLIERPKTGKLPAPYQIMEDLVAKYHPHLKDAKIAMAWNTSWRATPDNKITLGKCCKASDLHRQMHKHDFVILLNLEVWNAEGFGLRERRALIDHELCHAQVKKDADGKPCVDSTGRTVYRMREHDIEEFSEIIKRHGIWKKDIEAFAKVCASKAGAPLLKHLQEEHQPTLPVIEPEAAAAPELEETELENADV